MEALTDQQIRGCFVNATRREMTQLTLPDLSSADWENLDYLGWHDRASEQRAYVVLDVDGTPTGLVLRGSTPTAGVRRKALCAWCADVLAHDVTLWVARRAGSSGRAGNTVGTMVCTDFSCSANVRRVPDGGGGQDAEVRAALDAVTVERRITDLRERSARFAAEVLATR